MSALTRKHSTRSSVCWGLADVIVHSGDQDFFRFQATQTGRMTVDQMRTSGSSLDCYLYAYDAQGRLIASNDWREACRSGNTWRPRVAVALDM